jgi:hypothetical protein
LKHRVVVTASPPAEIFVIRNVSLKLEFNPIGSRDIRSKIKHCCFVEAGIGGSHVKTSCQPAEIVSLSFSETSDGEEEFSII